MLAARAGGRPGLQHEQNDHDGDQHQAEGGAEGQVIGSQELVVDDIADHLEAAAAEQVMAVLDQINRKWGRGTLRPAGVPAAQKWAMRR